MAAVTAVMVGGGNRARYAYAPYARSNPDDLRIVAIAEPDPQRRRIFASENGIHSSMEFDCADSLYEQGRLADMAIIATQDRDHYDNALRAMELGYDLLLEKPISPRMDQCRSLLDTAVRLHRKVSVAHVLRFAPFYQTVRKLIAQKAIGELISLALEEDVGYWHFAHSYVRGAWRREDQSSPSILAKCCHDLDLIVWLCSSRCESLSSTGDLRWFRSDNAPSGSASRCLGGCKLRGSCPFDVEKIYVENEETGYRHSGWGPMLYSVTDKKDPDALMDALRDGPYGRCVYHCDNDVADSQIVIGRMENGVDFSLRMSAFSASGRRTVHVMGSRGEITGDLQKKSLTLQLFGQDAVSADFSIDGVYAHQGHGGGDDRLIREILRYERGETGADGNLTTLDLSMESHFMAFASELSRKNGSDCISMMDFRG